MKKISIVMLLAACWLSAFAQKTVTVSGTVVDDDGKPVPKVTVMLGLVTDPKKQVSSISDAEGRYEADVNEGTYLIVASAEGYYTFMATVSATENTNIPVVMTMQTRQLSEVVVTARRRLRYDAEGFSMKVNQIAALKDETMDVIMQFMPGFVVVNDQLTLFGQRYVSEVYVDRRRIHLRGRDLLDYLSSLRGENVSRVKVILSRGAEASASAANSMILKIETGKPDDGGMLSVTGMARPTGSNRAYSLPTLVFQNRAGSWSAYGSLTNRLSISDARNSSNTLFEESGLRREEQRRGDTKSIYTMAAFGLGYDFTPNDILTVNAGTTVSRSKSQQDHDIRTFLSNEPTATTHAQSERVISDISYRTGADYTHAWKQGEATAKLRYTEGRDRNRGELWRTGHEAEWSSSDRLKTTNRSYAFKIDMEQKLSKKHAVKAGTAYNAWHYDTRTDNRLTAGGAEQPTATFATQFDYRENISALYASYDFSKRRFSLSAGLRYEHELVERQENRQAAKQKDSYDHLFPNLRLNWLIDSDHGHNLRLSVARSLVQPPRSALNAAVQWDNEYEYSVGNTRLAPIAYYHGDATLMLFGKVIINAEYARRHQYAAYTYRQAGSNILYSAIDDSGRLQNASLKISYGRAFSRMWIINVNGTMNYTNEKHQGESCSDLSLFASTALNSNLSHGIRLQTLLAYFGPTESLQVKTKGRLQVGETIRKSLLKGRLNLSLAYQYWPTPSSTLKTQGVSQHRSNNYNPHRAEFTAQYSLRWGSLRPKVRQVSE